MNGKEINKNKRTLAEAEAELNDVFIAQVSKALGWSTSLAPYWKAKNHSRYEEHFKKPTDKKGDS